MAYSTDHIRYLERAFLDDIADPKRGLDLDWTNDLAATHWVRLLSVPTAEGQSWGAGPLDWLGAINSRSSPLVYGAIANGQAVALVCSVSEHDSGRERRRPAEWARTGDVEAETCRSETNRLMLACFPGLALAEIDRQLIDWALALPCRAVATGTPRNISLSTNNRWTVETGTLPLDRTIRALQTEQWSFLSIALPIPRQTSRSLRDSILNEQRLVADAVQSGGVPNAIAERYQSRLDQFLKKVDAGIATGLWQHIGLLLAETPLVLGQLKAIVRGALASTDAGPDHVRVLDLSSTSKIPLALPLLKPPAPPGKVALHEGICSLLSTTELASYLHLPSEEASGFAVRPRFRFNVTSRSAGEARADGLFLGTVERDACPLNAYSIDPQELTRHAFIGGLTGSGKSNTVFQLLSELARVKCPFMVIEPAKSEYRQLLSMRQFAALQVYTVGLETCSPLRLNPLAVMPGVPVQVHIDLLRATFSAAFGLFAPLPFVLERCLHRVYEQRGWDLVTSQNSRGSDSLADPTLDDLYEAIDPIVLALGYDERLTRDIQAALKTRIDSMRIGGKGLMLNRRRSQDIAALLSRPVILELENIGDDAEKAFLMGLLLVLLFEHRTFCERRLTSQLRHVTVVEEAHRLLGHPKKVIDEAALDAGGQAVETFTNLLAEVRAYGEGLVVVEQIPSKLVPDVIKNTNIKIAHRTVAQDERLLLGGSMAFAREQTDWLATADVGQAAVFCGGDDGPLIVRVPLMKHADDMPTQQLDRRVAESTADGTDPGAAGFERLRLLSRYLSSREEAITIGYRLLISAGAGAEAIREAWESGSEVAARLLAEEPVGSWKAADVVAWSALRALDDIGCRLRVQFADIRATMSVLQKLLGTASHSGDQVALDTAFQDLAAAFGQCLAQARQPYDGCSQACPDGSCLYRFPMARAVRDPYLAAGFADAMRGPKEAIAAAVWVAGEAAVRRYWAEHVPEEHRQRAGLCFVVQSMAAARYLDVRNRQKLIGFVVERAKASGGELDHGY